MLLGGDRRWSPIITIRSEQMEKEREKEKRREVANQGPHALKSRVRQYVTLR